MKLLCLPAKALLPLALIMIALLLGACDKKKEQFGAGIDPAAPMVTAQEILLQPQLVGQKVTVQGTVYTQCSSNGCWFVLQDGTAQLYIDLSTNNFELPPMPGRQVKVTGTVTASQKNLLIVAQGVEAI
jgi:hypothetical protein